jgi:succinate dehydrogenase/fumarate reductase flavoprotein subunit
LDVIEVDRTPIEADVLVVGGGIAGLMASIRVAELGAKTVVADKANPLRSGSAGLGTDHFICYIPEVHGPNIKPIIEEHMISLFGGWYYDLDLVYTYYKNSFEIVKRWESYGIPMRPHGFWEFAGHAFPNRPRIFLKYAGRDQKHALVKVAREKGVQIISKTPIIDLITKNGRVIGAIGLDVSRDEPLIKIFRAKSVVLCTGCTVRLFPSITLAWLFNISHCPANTGAGIAMAYRSGAKLVNMEIPYTHAGPKYLARAGKATWIGVLTDFYGNRISPWATKPSRELGDIAADIWHEVFDFLPRSGRSPVYMDCSETSDEDIEYMIWGLENEGNITLLDYLKAEGLNFKRFRYEFTRYEPIITGGRGIEIDVKGKTSLEGLYAAGDVVGNFRAGTGGAAVFGWIAGESAAEHAKKVPSFEEAEKSPVIEEKVRFCSSLLSRNKGASWKEFNIALQQIMNDYVKIRSATMLKAALKYLDILERKARNSLRVENSHELMRALEVFDLLEVGRIVTLAILQRDETRPPHTRLDCPWTNPLYNNLLLTIKNVDGKPVFEWRRRRESTS